MKGNTSKQASSNTELKLPVRMKYYIKMGFI